VLAPFQRVSSASRLPGRYRVETFTRWVAPPFALVTPGTGRGTGTRTGRKAPLREFEDTRLERPPYFTARTGRIPL